MTQLGNVLEIRLRVARPHAFILLVATILWNCAALIWVSVVGVSILALTDIFPVGVGLYLTYLTAVIFLNSTIIRASRDQIEVSYRPLPWNRPHRWIGQEIQQFHCARHLIRHFTWPDENPAPVYQLGMTLTGNRQVRLLPGLRDHREAYFIGRQLETHLGLPLSG